MLPSLSLRIHTPMSIHSLCWCVLTFNWRETDLKYYVSNVKHIIQCLLSNRVCLSSLFLTLSNPAVSMFTKAPGLFIHLLLKFILNHISYYILKKLLYYCILLFINYYKVCKVFILIIIVIINYSHVTRILNELFISYIVQ